MWIHSWNHTVCVSLNVDPARYIKYMHMHMHMHIRLYRGWFGDFGIINGAKPPIGRETCCVL
jgi:hypothetical protein